MAERKIRTKKKEIQEQEKEATTQPTKPVSQMLEECLSTDLEGNVQAAIDSSISDDQIRVLIDDLGEKDEELKRLKEEVDTRKTLVKEIAKHRQMRSMEGHEYTAKVGDSSKTEVVPTDFVKLLVKMNKKDMFDDLFSVKVGEAKKYLGADVVGEVTQEKKTPYTSVSVKRKKTR